jgi:hypothetical protein
VVLVLVVAEQLVRALVRDLVKVVLVEWEYRLTLQIMVPVPAHQLLLEHLDLVVQSNGSLAAVVAGVTTPAAGVEDLVEQVVLMPQDHQVVLEQVVMFQHLMHPSQYLGIYSLATMKGVQQHMELVVAVVALLGPIQVLMLEVMVVLVLLLLGINYQHLQQLMIHQLKQLVEQPM